ncbi:MAG: PA0069 family radical SAM protein [Rhodocyclaceae bacterium]
MHRSLNTRGAGSNRPSRFLGWGREVSDEGGFDGDDEKGLGTEVCEDEARSVISWNESPDIPFDRSINPYRGCEHGCIYCYARPTHAYLGLSPGLDFERKLFFKRDAAAVLRRELARPGYRPATIVIGANTDPYQPIERRLGLTRSILEVLRDCGHPLGVTTKSALIERDLDILSAMARDGLASASISVTTLDQGLARRLEPRAATPKRRLEAIAALAEAGVPTGVLVSPVIPALTDQDIERVLQAAAAAGAVFAACTLIRLPAEVRDLFADWLAIHCPGRASHVMSVIRQSRDGRDNDPRFGSRMLGSGHIAKLIQDRFNLACRRAGLSRELPSRRTDLFRPPRLEPDRQLSLF